MPRSVPAPVNPDVLVWARESARWSRELMAKAIGVDVAKVTSWESGDATPTLAQLRAFAKKCKRPLSVLMLDEPPRDYMPLEDYRSIAGTAVTADAPALAYQVRLAWERRETALDLYDDLGERPPDFGVEATRRSKPDTLAARLRDRLGTPIEAQMKARTAADALRMWRSAFEAAGVLVFQAPRLSENAMRGFSIGEHPLPVIVLNSKDAIVGKIFTLFHELAHVALRHGGVCDLEPRHLSPEKRNVEVYCNQVAASALMPAEVFLGQHIVVRNEGHMEWSNGDVTALARRFNVSREAALRRLLTFGRTTERHYKAMRAAFADEYERVPTTEPLRIPQDIMAISRNGRAYSQLVIAAYDANAITAADASDFLGAKPKYIAKIRDRAFSAAGTA